MMKLIRFFLYVRKSQARGDRQVLSIPAQIKEMTAYAEKLGIQIVAVFEEERTAKAPGRPVFNEMMERIEKGEADGILVWKIDRLSRNPIDDGKISWVLQEGMVQRIQTIERSYLPEDNVLFMRMEQGMANQYIRDLSRNVKRGMRTAAENGWYPVGILPLGYIRNTDKKDVNHLIIKDPVRFPIIQELWRLYSTGVYSILEILKVANQLGLKNRNGGKIHKNTLHALFKNTFYAGYFYWKNSDGNKIRQEGKHPAMVSEAEFLAVQDVIDKKSWKMRPKHYDFPYKGLIQCGECNGRITAEKKHRTTCTNCKRRFSSLHRKSCPHCQLEITKMDSPLVFERTYYHCTKSNNKRCSQKGISEEQIEKGILEVIEGIEITKEIYVWALSQIEKRNPFEENAPILLDSLKKKKIELNKKLTNLLDLRVSGEITREQNDQMHEKYINELEEVNKEIITRESAHSRWKNEAEKYLDFALDAVNKFKNASNFKKREILSVFLSSQKILDKTLYISTKKPLAAILHCQTGYNDSNESSIQKSA